MANQFQIKQTGFDGTPVAQELMRQARRQVSLQVDSELGVQLHHMANIQTRIDQHAVEVSQLWDDSNRLPEQRQLHLAKAKVASDQGDRLTRQLKHQHKLCQRLVGQLLQRSLEPFWTQGLLRVSWQQGFHDMVSVRVLHSDRTLPADALELERQLALVLAPSQEIWYLLRSDFRSQDRCFLVAGPEGICEVADPNIHPIQRSGRVVRAPGKPNAQVMYYSPLSNVKLSMPKDARSKLATLI